MDIKKQKLLLEYLISSPDTYAICASIVKSEYFDPSLRNSVSFIKDYYEHYNSTPDAKQVEAETGVELEPQEVSKDRIEYCSNEIEQFCKRRAFEKAVLAAPGHLEGGNTGRALEEMREALTVSLHKELGLRYFDDPEGRLRSLLETESPQTTGWKDVDALLDGGIVRKQMLLFSANSGGGKSIVMSNLGLNFMEQGFNVLYISLELSQNMVSKRFDSMVTGVHTAEWRQRITETATRIESVKDSMGELFIKRLPAGSNANDIRSYLKEFELRFGFVPDMLIVDYLDKMGTNEYVSADNIFTKDQKATEQLYEIGVDYNMWVVTASQQNRSAVTSDDRNHSHIAGGISKINETDVYISILMNDSMRAAGEMAFMFLKTRSSDGVGNTVYLKWNGKTLRITDPDDNGGGGGLNLKTKKKDEDILGNIDSGKKLTDLIQV